MFSRSTSKYARARTFAALLIVLAAFFPALAAADPGPAAQTSPPPAGTQGQGGPAPTVPSAPARRRFGHLPIIDIVPVLTNPQFYSSGPLKTNGQPTVDAFKNNGTGYDPLDVGATIRIPVTPSISAAFDRVVGGTLDLPNARVTAAATKTGAEPYVYNTFTRDVVLQYRLDETFRRFTFEEGLAFRHRIVGGSNTSNNPLLPTINSTEAHYGYVGVSYTTPPVKALLNSIFALAINADTQAVDHNVACLLVGRDGVAPTCPKGNTTGIIDENPRHDRVWETDQYVQVTVPVDRKHGLTLLAQDRWGALNFYENAPSPYRYSTSQTYFFTKRFTPVFAISLRVRDQWVTRGTPVVFPNAQHNGSIDVIANFHLDPNTLLR